MAKAKPKSQPKTKSTTKPAKMSLSQFISPLDDRILVQVDRAEKITAGGLIIPDTAEITGNLKGTVVAVGRGHRNKNGKIHPMELKVGDQVLISSYVGDQIDIHSHEVKILRESEVLGVLEK